MALVQEAVVEWSLQDHNGEPIALTRDGLMGDAVPRDLVDQAVGEINDFYESQRPATFRGS